MSGKIIEAAMRSKITIHVDENSAVLSDALRDSGFKIRKIIKGTPDEDIAVDLEGDVILTANTKDFKLNAVIYDFDIISIENIKYIDDSKTRLNETVKKISNAIRESEFYNKRGNFLLSVMNDGKWILTELK